MWASRARIGRSCGSGQMVGNLALDAYDDDHWEEPRSRSAVDLIIDVWLDRRYDPDGTGGIFPNPDTRSRSEGRRDLTYQMNEYFLDALRGRGGFDIICDTFAERDFNKLAGREVVVTLVTLYSLTLRINVKKYIYNKEFFGPFFCKSVTRGLKGGFWVDFYRIRQRMIKKDVLEVYPDFTVRSSFKDLMVRGKSFYAIWDEEAGPVVHERVRRPRGSSTRELQAYLDSLTDKFNCDIVVKWMGNYSTGSWRTYRKWLNDIPDSYHTLDDRLTFSNTDVVREDYVSKRLGYPLQEGSISAYDEMIGTLYAEDERRKIEWAVEVRRRRGGPEHPEVPRAVREGGGRQVHDSQHHTAAVRGILHDLRGEGARVEQQLVLDRGLQDQSPRWRSSTTATCRGSRTTRKLNSIVSHEEMTMNEKYKPSYTSRVNCFLFMATNRPVKITDAKSGIIRRLIDVKPSGNKIPPLRYRELMGKIPFELSGIAWHCLKVYEQLGKDYYEAYRPVDMMFKTDVFFNFIEDSYFTFLKQDGVSLKQAYDMYKQYCNEALVEYKMPKYRFREELKNYFREFSEITRVNGKQIRNYYNGFITDQFKSVVVDDLPKPVRLELESTESIFDRECADCPAQYATKDETPIQRWDDVTTKLSDIDTSRLHYVRVPENHIVIDFDLRGDDGEKSALRNLEEAAKWPATYAEFSKGGAGVHLHYIYDGDVSQLSRLYSYGVEIKVFNGKSSLRRRLSKCNDLPIAHISSGLPLKEGDKMINKRTVQSERGLRDLIERNLRKEIHPGTKPSVDFIKKILDDAYSSGLSYDVSDLMPKIMVFANNSTHQADYCLNLVSQMKFKSDNPAEPGCDPYSDDRIVFFDVEVFPNLFLVNWKYDGDGTACVRMINPTPQEIEQLLQMKLVGFNCRRYDNHILYARYLGYSNLELYRLSQRIVNGDRNAFFGEAYNISYTDVYDFASAGNKMSLKKWEIELGIHHQELGLPWDQPVPEDQWEKVAEYCDNDVISTEAVFHHLSGDWAARQILAELSGLTVNDTTNQHSTKIIFQGDKHPQDKFIYTDLSEMFPGYSFDPTRKGKAKSQYKGYDVGEGGRVYAEPGMYTNVGLFDVASMHPSSIEALNLFGPYTKRFSDLKQGRIYIKHHDWEKAKHILDGAPRALHRGS